MSDAGERGKAWLEKLLQLMSIPAAVEVQTLSGEDEACWLAIATDNLTEAQVETLIGADGKTIDAIQYLANTLLNLEIERDQRQPYTIDVAGYRAQRQAVLKEQVDSAIAQVKETGQEVEMPPLSSAERRQVHNLFSEIPDFVTESRGSEPNRRIYVRLQTAES